MERGRGDGLRVGRETSRDKGFNIRLIHDGAMSKTLQQEKQG
jgi:hypothetical protein